MFEHDKISLKQSGKADLNSTFFLGAESDESEQTGVSYFVTEFPEIKTKDCYLIIRLGYEAETGIHLLGKLKKNCNEKIMAIDNFSLIENK